jgi:hypothetical protein
VVSVGKGEVKVAWSVGESSAVAIHYGSLFSGGTKGRPM